MANDQIPGFTPDAAVAAPSAPIAGFTSDADAAASTQPPTFMQNVWGGIKKAGNDVIDTVKGIAPATNTNASASLPGKSLGMAEDVATGINNLTGITTVVDSVKNAAHMFDAYETARSNGSSITEALHAANERAKAADAITPLILQRGAEWKKNPTAETVRALGDVVATAAAVYGLHRLGSPAAPAAPEEAAAPKEVTPPTKPPNPFRRALATPAEKGEMVSQPLAQTGVRTNAPTVGASFRSGIDVDTPYAQAKTLYQTVDNAAKTDFKGLYDKLDAAQDRARLAAPGSPEEASAQRDIQNTDNAILDAKKIAAQSGVADVDKLIAQADAKFTEAQANKDFNSRFFGSQSVVSGDVAHGAPEKIDVDAAIKTLQNMDKKNRYGVSRLQQTSLGTDGAAKLKQSLYDAQKAGEKAMDGRALRNKVLKLASFGAPTVGAIGAGAYELTK